MAARRSYCARKAEVDHVSSGDFRSVSLSRTSFSRFPAQYSMYKNCKSCSQSLIAACIREPRSRLPLSTSVNSATSSNAMAHEVLHELRSKTARSCAIQTFHRSRQKRKPMKRRKGRIARSSAWFRRRTFRGSSLTSEGYCLSVQRIQRLALYHNPIQISSIRGIGLNWFLRHANRLRAHLLSVS
jgi:hypothetical protein